MAGLWKRRVSGRVYSYLKGSICGYIFMNCNASVPSSPCEILPFPRLCKES